MKCLRGVLGGAGDAEQGTKEAGVLDLFGEGGADVGDVAEVSGGGDVGGGAVRTGEVGILDDGADQGVVVEGGGEVFGDQGGGEDLVDGVLCLFALLLTFGRGLFFFGAGGGGADERDASGRCGAEAEETCVADKAAPTEARRGGGDEFDFASETRCVHCFPLAMLR